MFKRLQTSSRGEFLILSFEHDRHERGETEHDKETAIAGYSEPFDEVKSTFETRGWHDRAISRWNFYDDRQGASQGSPTFVTHGGSSSPLSLSAFDRRWLASAQSNSLDHEILERKDYTDGAAYAPDVLFDRSEYRSDTCTRPWSKLDPGSRNNKPTAYRPNKRQFDISLNRCGGTSQAPDIALLARISRVIENWIAGLSGSDGIERLAEKGISFEAADVDLNRDVGIL
ncbi:hypothetical protein K0M31_017852 [Melipona bicolor]|uniref:Uncharacterized protein n=1 Tax=Melipona bicolor TaxID=60889 RepID=A0AA40G5N0_9HYME|nr:hypothetical protein K0M31_017852 [Melipona bicolor]